MPRGVMIFSAIFLLVPLIAILAALFAPAGLALGLVILALTLLILGFVVGLGFIDVD